ncbi:M13 family metallopeptidase [Clostridium sp. SM-530-WT-3G]|uniref:M13-type metalloendopeptidase n=1 Tax=Clostridium sp. SM-530-WT-3G TaxID=2725303 RepID=UPI00145EF20A|nr:M13 family metallopeptidase [Clostridium sp. SM-530-WT-3G]NME84394.1 M13 family metallopeptidase [Clostridium sp. SM-530-WT-3G]
MKKVWKKTFMSFIAAILCSFQFVQNTAVYGVTKTTSECRQIRIQDDFYGAVNKEWFDSVKLEEGCVSYGAFEELCGKVNGDILNIILDIKDNRECYAENSDELKFLNLYENFMNKKERNRRGIEPIDSYLCRVDNIENIEDFREVIGQQDFSYFQTLINFGVGADCKNSKMNILYIGPSCLGLGNSLYYKDNSKDSQKIKNAYINYIERLHFLSGEDKKIAKDNAKDFFEFECKIAEDIPTYEEEAKDKNRIEKSYNVYTLDKLENEAPNVEFTNLLCKFNVENANKIVVDNPNNINKINSLMCNDNIGQLKNFLKTTILMNTDNILTMKFREAGSGMKKILYGGDIPELDECSGIKFASSQLNGIVSRLYINRYFNKESKEDVENLVCEIVENFDDRLEKNEWMSEKTKEQAISKLNNINVKVGYPNEWKDYSSVNIRSYEEGGSLVENIINIYVDQCNKQFSKLNNPVDKSEWNMAAFTVNAYYSPLNNEIVFPAAILQEPFYSQYYSKEKNLGGIGAVIGHELTHAFDNTGAKFNKEGMLENWWTPKDYEEFINRSQKVINYYSNIEVDEGKYVNGFLTVGENISDLGGVACVLDIAKKCDDSNLKELFENYATIWREISTKELKDFLLKNDPHSPKKVRVNGVLSQFEEFYETYDVKKGDKMYINPEDRLIIW